MRKFILFSSAIMMVCGMAFAQTKSTAKVSQKAETTCCTGSKCQCKCDKKGKACKKSGKKATTGTKKSAKSKKTDK